MLVGYYLHNVITPPRESSQAANVPSARLTNKAKALLYLVAMDEEPWFDPVELQWPVAGDTPARAGNGENVHHTLIQGLRVSDGVSGRMSLSMPIEQAAEESYSRPRHAFRRKFEDPGAGE